MTSPVYQPTPPSRRKRSALTRQRRMILILLIVVAMLASSFAVVIRTHVICSAFFQCGVIMGVSNKILCMTAIGTVNHARKVIPDSFPFSLMEL